MSYMSVYICVIYKQPFRSSELACCHSPAAVPCEMSPAASVCSDWSASTCLLDRKALSVASLSPPPEPPHRR